MIVELNKKSPSFNNWPQIVISVRESRLPFTLLYCLLGGSRSSCTTEECRQRQNVIMFVMAGGFAVIILIYCACCGKDEPSVDNETFVNSNPHQVEGELVKREMQMHSLVNSSRPNIFRNGMWASRYYQYGNWNGPFEFVLSFDPETNRLKGWGWDNVGKFDITGTYSNKFYRMGITKTYVRGTGDTKQNLGHSVIIQLTGNAQTGKFEGKWYVSTHKYQGEDKFELSFVRECEYFEVV